MATVTPMSNVSEREFFERILEEHDKAHDAQHQAVELAAKELERRLDILNHAHERSQEERSHFLQREKYDSERVTAALEVKALAEKVEDTLKVRAAAVDDRFSRVDEKIEDRFNQNARISDDRLAVLQARLAPLEKFHDRSVFIGGGLVVLGGVIGAVVIKVLGG